MSVTGWSPPHLSFGVSGRYDSKQREKKNVLNMFTMKERHLKINLVIEDTFMQISKLCKRAAGSNATVTAEVLIGCVKEKPQARNGITVLKPRTPKLDFIPDQFAVSNPPRNRIFIIFWSSTSKIISHLGPLHPHRKTRRSA